MNDSYAIRIEMTKLGWYSEDRITQMGWGTGPNASYGFSIWFERWNWHGKRCDKVSYHAHTADLTKIPEATAEVAERAKKAWNEFPECPPSQLAGGRLDNSSNKEIWKAAGLLDQ